MEIPSAPPGLPNYFCVWEAERCFEWLNRTVMSWTMELEEFYSTPDPNQFWAIGVARGDVLWGKEQGHFQSKFFLRMEFKDGKVHYIKTWVDALAFLRAACLDYTRIIKATDDPRVDEFLANTPKRFTINGPKPAENPEDVYAGLDMSEEAIAKRLEANLGQNVCGVEREKYRAIENFHPNYSRGAWFIPDYLPWCDLPEEEYSLINNSDPVKKAPPELGRRQHAWVKMSSPWMYRDTRGKNYPTDDKFVYFSEMYSNGPCLWAGNGFERGHYHEQFLMVQKFDKAGRELIRDEVICPQYKYASTQIPLPSFPYYA
ncbi:MAG: phenazine biosynthesis protein [Clostridiales bacterium]|nr:phenazine biosynthesis protein [Clostridiales bacterium]